MRRAAPGSPLPRLARFASRPRRPAPSPRRPPPRLPAAAPDGPVGARVQAYDVVLYDDDPDPHPRPDPHPDPSASPTTFALGHVAAVVDDERCEVHPLDEEEGNPGVWLESHERPPTVVRLERVALIVDHDFAQRMAPDRVSNPHGEHAEDVWRIATRDLPPNTRRR
jgi:hypothetical protein